MEIRCPKTGEPPNRPKEITKIRLRHRSARLALMLLSACVAGWPPQFASAVPARPDGVEVAQPDGAKFRLHLRGDEFFSWHETADGYAVARDTTDGFWKFAQPAVDRAEFQVISAARVGSSDPARFSLRRNALPHTKVLRAEVEKHKQALRGTPLQLPVPQVRTAASSQAGTRPSNWRSPQPHI